MFGHELPQMQFDLVNVSLVLDVHHPLAFEPIQASSLESRAYAKSPVRWLRKEACGWEGSQTRLANPAPVSTFLARIEPRSSSSLAGVRFIQGRTGLYVRTD